MLGPKSKWITVAADPRTVDDYLPGRRCKFLEYLMAEQGRLYEKGVETVIRSDHPINEPEHCRHVVLAKA